MGVEFIYFDIHGLGVMPRMVLAAGGVDFTDTRVTFPQWAEMKKSKFYLFFENFLKILQKKKNFNFLKIKKNFFGFFWIVGGGVLKMKNNFVFQAMPLGQVPILKTDGLTVNQSNAIINWAVRNGDLPKLSCEESSKSDMVVETCREVFDGVRMPAFAAMRAIAEDKKVQDF